MTLLEQASCAEAGIDQQRVDDLDAFMHEQVASGAVPGAAVMATRHQRVFVRAAWGNRLDGAPCDPSIVFPFMSFSKAVTASMIGQVQSGGGFEWDDLVSEYLPGYGCKGKEATTIRHLMTHAAGIPSGGAATPLAGPEDWASVVDVLCAMDAEWAPGSRTAYHGLSGLLLAAEIARRVSGRGFGELCTDLVLDPIGATPTLDPPADASLPIAADDDRVPILTVGRWHPAGGFYGRLDDILRVLHLHLDRGRVGERSVLAPSAWDEMHRVQYAEQIETARAAGQQPAHEFWALGLLLRGDVEPNWLTSLVTHWFGLAGAPTAAAFSHAGTSTVLGIAEPTTDIAVAVMTTSELAEGDAVAVRREAARLLGAAASA